MRDGAPAGLGTLRIRGGQSWLSLGLRPARFAGGDVNVVGTSPIETLETFFKEGVIAVTIDAWSHFEFAILEWFTRPPLVAVSALLWPVP